MTDAERPPKKWLFAAIAVRIVVFFFLAPGNNDDHGDVIRRLVQYGRMPTLWETQQAQHAPLYYLMAAPFWKLTGDFKAVQMLSLLFSIGTLLVLYHLIYQTPLIPNRRARTSGFLMVSLLPQFVMFSLYVSNDTAAIFLGNLAILQAWRYIQSPDRRQLILLGAVTALGLLAKLTLLAYLPVFAGLVFWRNGRTRRAAVSALAFFTITFAAGSYKMVDNYLRFGQPMITGLDPRFHNENVLGHRASYRGLSSYLDVNVFKLVPNPVLSPSTSGSYPVILYATFWYQYVPESSFIGNRKRPEMYLGSVIYIAALLPTVIFLIGCLAALRPIAAGAGAPDIARWMSGLLLLLTGLIFTSAIIQNHAWSWAQARYLFPMMGACLMAFAEGVRLVEHQRVLRVALAACMWTLGALFLIYFGRECSRWL